MKKTYLFYDLETTGLNPCFDQVLQFAAIRTDLQLHELERYEFQVKLNCDIILSPGAMITHRIGIDQSQTGISELAAITQIHQLLNTPGTISLGYNTLGFDDEFLRFSFYRNLLPPYTHQYAQQCSRMDLYPFTVMFHLFNPAVLSYWPSASLKLEHISTVNQLAQGQAHTAMVDVEATVALAKKFIQARDMWDFLLGYFHKDTDLSRLSQLNMSEALLVDGKLGMKQNYIAPVLCLGQHAQYKNQTLWLRLDLDNLRQTTVDKIAEHTYVIRKKPAENELLLPIKPRYLEKLSAERQQMMAANKLWLQQNPELFAAICDYHRHYIYPKVPSIDADAALYELGFATPQEETLLKNFHRAAPTKKMAIANQFAHPIRKQQALRIMGRHFFSELSVQDQDLFNEYLQKALHSTAEQAPVDYRGQRKLTLCAAMAELAILKNSPLDPEQQILLVEFDEHCRSKLS